MGRRASSAHRPLTPERILAWADAYREATGRWPSSSSGLVPEAPAPGETWAKIHSAPVNGHRGPPGGRRWRVLSPARPRR